MLATLRDRKTGKERDVRIEPGPLTGTWELWTLPKRIFVPAKDDPKRRIPITIPERKLSTVHTGNIRRNRALDRIEVSL